MNLTLKTTTKTLARLGAAAALATAAMTAVAAPADAQVRIGIGFGGPAPVYYRPGPNWCYWHPGACGYYGPHRWGWYHRPWGWRRW